MGAVVTLRLAANRTANRGANRGARGSWCAGCIGCTRRGWVGGHDSAGVVCNGSRGLKIGQAGDLGGLNLVDATPGASAAWARANSAFLAVISWSAMAWLSYGNFSLLASKN